jgi:hypothetical protein
MTRLMMKDGYMNSSTRIVTSVGASAALLLALGIPGAAAASAQPETRAACATPQGQIDADALGEQLTTRFLRLLKKRDVPGLRAFLAPNFQIMRSNGVPDTKRSYLKKDLPDIESFKNDRVHGLLSGSTLTVRYWSKVKGTAAGGTYTPGYAPRLSTFTYCSGDWQLVSHANFNPLTGTAS